MRLWWGFGFGVPWARGLTLRQRVNRFASAWRPARVIILEDNPLSLLLYLAEMETRYGTGWSGDADWGLT